MADRHQIATVDLNSHLFLVVENCSLAQFLHSVWG